MEIKDSPHKSTTIIKEITSKSILSPSQIYDYVINPYVGCQHGCTFCYARYMKRFTHHKEPWGEFVDVKINAPDLLRKEITRKHKGTVWVSGVCDPYQPLEEKYHLTGDCVEILAQHHWPMIVQTRSPLVLRDINIFKDAPQCEVGMSIDTADDHVRELFEPMAPPIHDRLDALDCLHKAGVRTYAMIAPLLPGAEGLSDALKGKIDYVLIDKMNYNHAVWVYKKHNLHDKLSEAFYCQTSQQLAADFRYSGIKCQIV
jgi:DNA repair photolyase